MIDKSLLELMLEKNMRGELAGNFDSMEMREILQKGIELFEENGRLTKEIQQLQKPEETNRTIVNICGMDLTIYYSDDEREKVKQLVNMECENERLQQWVNDLQSGMYVNCVYCGHRYGPESKTPVSMADVLKQHIEQCPEHPMSKLKQENERLKILNNNQRQLLKKLTKRRHSLYEYCPLSGNPCVDRYEEARGEKFFDPANDGFGPVNLNEVEPDKVPEYYSHADSEIIIKESSSNEMLDEALAYHNPADVAEIERLKEELNTFTHQEQCRAYAGLETTVQDMGNALKLARDLIYNNMPYPANTSKYDKYLQVLRALENAIGGQEDGI